MDLAIIWAIYITAQIADILTTNAVLKRGGYEMNPVVRVLMSTFGSNWAYFKAGLTILFACAAQYFGYPVVILVVGGLTGAVAFNNWWTVLRK